MAYNSTRTGPEIDAAVQLLGEIQTIRNESNSNLATVQTLAGQVQANATSAVTSATTATTKAAEATTKAAAANASASAALASESAAASSKTTAQTASSSAQGSATAASASAQAAAQSRTAAGLSELMAAGYAGQTAALNAQQTALARSLLALGDKGQSLHLDFALKAFAKGDRNGLTSSAAFSDLITFTRASTGTYFDINGVLKTAAANEPRFDYDPITRAAKGLLIEEQRTNLLKYSEQLDNAAWVKANATVTTNTIAAPDGSLTADKLIETTVNSTHFAYQQPVTVADSYTLSAFLKAGERFLARLRVQENGLFVGAGVFDLSNGTVQPGSAAGQITPVGNGWYRCSITVTSAGAAAFQGQVWVMDNSGAVSYLGDGVSGLYVWGAELKPGVNQDSYIPTVASQVTRASDVASVNDLNGWYNAAQGTLLVEGIQAVSNTFYRWPAAFYDGVNSKWGAALSSNGFSARGVVNSGGVDVANLVLGTVTPGVPYKMAIGARVDDFAGALNGGAVATDTSGEFPPVTSLGIGSLGMAFLGGHLKSIRYIPKRLTNSELQALSA